MQGAVAVVGSVLILTWPIVVMLVRSLIEASRWNSILMARAWIGAWFSGVGIIITAAWIMVVVAIRLITDAFLADQDSVGAMTWVLMVGAMVIMVPFAIRRPKDYEP